MAQCQVLVPVLSPRQDGLSTTKRGSKSWSKISVIWSLGLYDVLPVPVKEQNRMVVEDIKSLLLDIGRLEQLEITSEEVYPAWPEAASMIVAVSEVASTALSNPSKNTRVQDLSRLVHLG